VTIDQKNAEWERESYARTVVSLNGGEGGETLFFGAGVQDMISEGKMES